MSVLLIILIFILGISIGSFINALIYRLRHNKKIVKGRSICPHCQHVLGWKDLIPIVSFMLLKGKCRYCQKKVSWQYPIVETITGLLFVVVFLTMEQWSSEIMVSLSHGFIVKLLAYWLFTTILIVIFIYDLKYYLILDKVTIPSILIVLILNLLIQYSSPQFLISNFKFLIFSAIIGGGFFVLQFLISSGRWIGGGDIRLGVLMGVLLGWPGILVALFLSYILGSIVSLGLITLKKKKIKSKIPFGTFLTLGAFITLLWGHKILDWYLWLVGY